MELNKFISDFASQFEETDSSRITATTKFQNLGEWSSLTAISVIAMAKTEYDKKLTGEELRSCITVEDLFKFLNSK